MRRMYSKPQLLEAVEQESKLNGIKVFEDIKDKDGHNRFIEGDITLETIEGFTAKYGKWSLSGSHLLIVLSADVANATVIPAYTILTKITLPSWIHDKIAVLYGSNLVAVQSIALFDSNGGSQNLTIRLRKRETTIEIDTTSLTLNADRTFRLGFDLLIDNE